MIDFHKIYTDLASWVAVTVVGGMAAWVVALRRKVNTNEAQILQDRTEHQKQLALIMQRLDIRDQQREDDREVVKGLEKDVRESRQDIREIRNAILGKNR